MFVENLNLLQSQTSQNSFKLIDEKISNDQIDSGLLYCEKSKIALPIVNGFALFGEAKPWSNKLSAKEWIADLKESKFLQSDNYVEFLKEKERRGSSDTYAAFQPFNESSRALYPFISLLGQVLKPGDVILDTWCRTGWTGELLAGLFPQQRVISLWEGDSNVLGYKGYSHWLNSTRRHPNLEVVFTHPDEPLPFDNNSFSVVHGLDSLHRYEKNIFLNECLRICKDDGILIFPHIHLTNSEPEPFFERGCQQYHGSEWKSRVDALVEPTERKCWILPEVELFNSDSSLILKDDSLTPHYNALLLIAPEKFEGYKLEPSKLIPLKKDFRLVLNPLFNIDLNQGLVTSNIDRLGGFAPEMLLRHPCYDQLQKEIKQSRLTDKEASLLWQSQHGLTLDSIAVEMKISNEEVLKITESLSKRELVHPAPISKAMWDLQNFYGFVKLPKKISNNFSEVWQDLGNKYKSNPMICWIQDSSELMFNDVDFLVNKTRIALRAQNINKDSRIGIASGHHPAALILSWACWLEGICVVVFDENQSPEEIYSLRQNSKVDWLFTDNFSLFKSKNSNLVFFDSAEEDNSLLSEEYLLFSVFLNSDSDEILSDTKINPNTDAVILFSSGSSGKSKSVVLSQRALCVSGFNMVSTFNWKNEKLLSLGPFSMMSGLRNSMVASLVSASTIILPGRETLMPINAWQQAQDLKVTVITTVPSWLEILLTAESRLSISESVKQVLVTGSPLKENVKNKFTAKTNISVEDYYGLTETGGLCLATNSSFDENTQKIKEGNCIGYPVGALIHIVDEKGKLVGSNQTGLLKVYSNQLMDRYMDNPDDSKKAFENGWFLTGDLAYWDETGRVYLKGRIDDLIKLRDGTKLYPNSLERLLTGLPGVKDAAVTISEPFNSLLGLVVTDKPTEELLNELQLKHPNIKLPDKLKSVVSLPYNRNGKLKRNLLHNLANEK